MSHKAVVETALNESESRYEAFVGGVLAGIAEFEIDDERIVFTHTEVDDAFEGQGVAGQLARAALDDVRASGKYRVVPRCPYIKKWIDKHPDYQDLLHRH